MSKRFVPHITDAFSIVGLYMFPIELTTKHLNLFFYCFCVFFDERIFINGIGAIQKLRRYVNYYTFWLATKIVAIIARIFAQWYHSNMYLEKLIRFCMCWERKRNTCIDLSWERYIDYWMQTIPLIPWQCRRSSNEEQLRCI